MTRVIVVEYAFDAPLDDGARSELERRLAPCFEVREVNVVTTYLSADKRRRIAVLEAADAETVRHAHRSAGVAFQTAWPAEQD